ncbi:alpha/beta hydrolase [Brevibacterium linens]|uniref:AB hydrolase-1 domain-containing protein n=1 Tax=Brevibacterium linens TaxID=1703 RepID=A0A0B9APK0_BRELN|nr:alpha/beta hydrolase [Brevibacterium linens]KHS52737.1 hypothetical protein AE0388_1720 [Brevibacterium linens]
MFASLPLDYPRYRSSRERTDGIYNVKNISCDTVSTLMLDAELPARYSINDPNYSLPLDVLFYPRQSKRLLVGFHGAEPPSSSLPKFQFVSSFRMRPEASLFLSDPTILQGESMTLGWIAGNSTTPVADLMSDIVKLAAAEVGATEVVLVGHSAGGFAAVQVGSRIPGSKAIVVNGQSVVGAHRPYTVENLRKFAFPEYASVDEMLNAYSHRLDLRLALDKRSDGASFTWFSHVDDRLSFTDHPHVPMLLDHFRLPSDGGITSFGDAVVPCRWTTSNPSVHALPGSVIPFLNLVLGDTPGTHIDHKIDPVWHR